MRNPTLMTARARCTFVVMVPYRPLTALETHEVSNQPPPLVDFNAFDADRAIQDGVSGSGAGLHKDRLGAFGELVGRAETLELGRLANENPPTLKGFDRFGQRLDEVEFHPAYHALMQMGIAEFGAARGANNRLNEHIVRWERWSVKDAITESTARAFVEDTALGLQAAALRDGPNEVLEGFCAVRLPAEGSRLAYGAFTVHVAANVLIQRALPLI